MGDINKDTFLHLYVCTELARGHKSSGVATGGGGNWGHAPWGAGSGRASTHFIQPYKNAFFSIIQTEMYLKLRIFWKKSCKIVAASGALPPNSRWPPAAGDSASRPPCCSSRLRYFRYSFVELISSVKLFYLHRKITEITNSKCSILLLPRFWPIFHFKFCSFC